LTQSGSGGEVQILRRFEVLMTQFNQARFFSVLDDERSGCPWPESYGLISAAAAGNGPVPHLVYQYDGSLYSLPLPPVHMTLPDAGSADQPWTVDSWTYEVVSKVAGDNSEIWNIAATERRGRRQALQVDAASGQLQKSNQDVFMGQGIRFNLTLTQTSSEPIAQATATATTELIEGLLELQKELNRRPDTQTGELSPRQIESASAMLVTLLPKARDTPLQETVIRIARDVERQKRRVMATMNRQDQLLNQPAPPFALNLVDGKTLSSEALKGKIVVLHFWSYKDKPLSEPYGQVGYLDFLASQRRSANVAVVGIATSPALQSADSVQRGRRSARKLIEFMNIGYPVGYDDGSLLRALGDPRESNGELPLWVVLSADGKIVHYRSGFYEIDRQRGLRELDDILIEQVRGNR
jgi:peroxiredoxin